MCNEPTPIRRWLRRARLSAHLSETQRMSLAAEVEQYNQVARSNSSGWMRNATPAAAVPIGFPIKNCARLRMKGTSDVIAPEVRLARSSAADCGCPTRVGAAQDGFEVRSRKRRWRWVPPSCFVPGETFRCQLNGMVRPFIFEALNQSICHTAPNLRAKEDVELSRARQPIGREV